MRGVIVLGFEAEKFSPRCSFSNIVRFVAIAVLVLFIAPLASAKDSMPETQLDDKDSRYAIALLVSSRKGETSPKIEAIKYGARLRVDAINRSGGINGHPVRLLILDDFKNPDNTVSNIKRALEEPDLIAMVGLDSSTRGAKVMEAIGNSRVPFISDISLDSLFTDYRNIFSMTSSISGDTRVMTRFLGENYHRAVFIGRKDELFAQEFHKALSRQDKVSLEAVHWMPRDARKFAQAADLAIADIKVRKPDILCISVFSYHGAQFVKYLRAAGIDLPIYFGTGSVYSILRNTADVGYKGDLFGIGRGIPNVEGERLAQLGKQNEYRKLRKLYPDFLGNGVIYSDLLNLIATAAIDKEEAKTRNHNIPRLRQQIVNHLLEYRQGRKSFQGDWRNWSFTPSRSSALSSFVLWAPDGGPKLQLWPVQHVRTLAGDQKAPVAFVNVDLIGIEHSDTNDHQFSAEFYLSLSSATDIDIRNMKFSNAVQGENGDPFLNIHKVHEGRSAPPHSRDAGSSERQNMQSWLNKLYLVKGKFRFNPELAQYPFDSQRFSIAIEPRDTVSPFLIQPNDASALSNGAHIEGWRLLPGKRGEYVGYEEDDIIVVRDYGGDQQTMPYYRFNFSWVAKRVTKDYLMRVVVPLVLILMVAYLSVFLPTEKIDSIVAMKVTALLSTVALYFSIPKLETETATLSDQIFVFSELIIVVMVFISIIRVHATARRTPVLSRVLFALEVIVFPLAAFLMFRYVLAVSTGVVKSATHVPIGELSNKIMPTLF